MFLLERSLFPIFPHVGSKFLSVFIFFHLLLHFDYLFPLTAFNITLEELTRSMGFRFVNLFVAPVFELGVSGHGLFELVGILS